MSEIHQHLITGDPNAANTILFAHGAGAGMEHRFMQYFAENLAFDGWRVIRFEFPYMQQIRKTGTRRPPNSQKDLIASWLDQVTQFRCQGKLVVAGKSMGGRMASMIADDVGADGLIVFGYPFHPPKKPHKLRTQHLLKIKTPSIFLQGERDSLGNKIEVSGYSLADNILLRWLVDGDHSFKPRKKSGLSEMENWQQALAWCRDYLTQLK